jgi:hypothetical protein
MTSATSRAEAASSGRRSSRRSAAPPASKGEWSETESACSAGAHDAQLVQHRAGAGQQSIRAEQDVTACQQARRRGAAEQIEVGRRTPDHGGAGGVQPVDPVVVDTDDMHGEERGIEEAGAVQRADLVGRCAVRPFRHMYRERRAAGAGGSRGIHPGGIEARRVDAAEPRNAHREIEFEVVLPCIVVHDRGHAAEQILQCAEEQRVAARQ